MSSFPMVSVIVPIYNAEKTLATCIDSVLQQTFQDYELILIDDGSSDQSLALAETYAQKNPQIRVLTKPNTGASDTRNLGIRQAQGTYLAFLDSDDYLDKDYLETFVTAIGDDDMVIGGIKQVDANGQVLGQMVLGQTEWAKYMVTSPCTRLIRTAFLRQENLFFYDYTMEDIHFNALFFSKTKNVKTIPYVGYNNFVNPTSTTRTLHQGIRPEVDLLYLLEALWQEVPIDDYVRFFYQKVYMYYLLHTGKQSPHQTFVAEHRRIKSWLIDHQLASAMSPFDKRLSDERFSTRLIMFAFSIMEHLGLVPLFARLYCQGELKRRGH